MLKLRTQMSFFTIWLLLFFNIERLVEMINIASFVYIFVPLVATLILFAPSLIQSIDKKWLLLSCIILFFIIKHLAGYQILGKNLPITITEIFSIYISCYLANNLSLRIREFEDMVATLTFQQIGLPPKLYESTDTEDLYREVKRCRRFGHPLSLMIVKPSYDKEQMKSSQIIKEIQSAFASRYVQVRLTKLYSEKLRDTDLIVINDDDIIILLPETSEKDASIVLDNIKEKALAELNIDVVCGLSSFPNHSVTLNGLLSFAGKDIEEQMKEKNKNV